VIIAARRIAPLAGHGHVRGTMPFSADRPASNDSFWHFLTVRGTASILPQLRGKLTCSGDPCLVSV